MEDDGCSRLCKGSEKTVRVSFCREYSYVKLKINRHPASYSAVYV